MKIEVSEALHWFPHMDSEEEDVEKSRKSKSTKRNTARYRPSSGSDDLPSKSAYDLGI